MGIKIITDSTCDLDRQCCDELGIEMLPLTLYFGEETYRDGIDMTREEFYTRLTTEDVLPTTSQVNPAAYLEAFERVGANGDDILVITLSSKLSGTYQSACIAAEQYTGSRIRIVDSGNVTAAMGSLVLVAQKEVAAGKSLDEVGDYLDDIKQDLVVYASLDTLTYLQKGGRLSTTSAIVGGLLGIKPVVRIKNGKIESVHKAHGFKAAIKWVEETALASNINTDLPVCIAHAINPEGARRFQEDILGKIDFPTLYTMELGAVIGVYAGPHVVGIAFYTKRP